MLSLLVYSGRDMQGCLLWYLCPTAPGLLSVLAGIWRNNDVVAVGFFSFLLLDSRAEEETMFRNAAKKPLHHSRRPPPLLWRFLHLLRWYRLIALADRSTVTQLCLFTSINHGEGRKQGGVEYVEYLLRLLMLRGTLYRWALLGDNVYR